MKSDSRFSDIISMDQYYAMREMGIPNSMIDLFVSMSGTARHIGENVRVAVCLDNVAPTVVNRLYPSPFFSDLIKRRCQRA